MQVILLILGGVGSGIIPQHYDHTADELHQTELDEGICRHVQTDAFEKGRGEMAVD